MSKTIILNKEDINTPLHPNLWYEFLNDLGVDKEAGEICLCLSSLDDNKKEPEELEEVEEKIMYHNYYKCDDCNVEWEDDWDCMCDDECPDCGTPYSPYQSDSSEEEPKKQPMCWKCASKIIVPNDDGVGFNLKGCKENKDIHNYREAETLCPLIPKKII